MIKRIAVACFALLSLPVLVGSGQASRQQKAEAELLAIHQADRSAHFRHDVGALLEHTGAQVLDVREGKITRMSREDLRQRFVRYFHKAEFSAWDDVEPPVIQVSPDGELGWMVVRVHIAFVETDAQGKKIPHSSTMAWMSTYERRDGTWMMTAATSTEDPGAH